MAWDDITATLPDFGPELAFLDRFLPVYNSMRQKLGMGLAQNVVGIYRDEAKAQLLRDLQERLGLNPENESDMAAIETAIEEKGERLGFILSRCQLWFTYENVTFGEGTLNEQKRKIYKARYESFVSSLKSIRSAAAGGGSTTTTIRIWG